MDPASKVIALQQELDVEPGRYKELGEHLDLMHKIQFGTLDYKARAKDDPMGLSLTDEHKPTEPSPPFSSVAPYKQAHAGNSNG